MGLELDCPAGRVPAGRVDVDVPPGAGPGDFGDPWEDQVEYVVVLDHAFPFTDIEIRRADDDTLVVMGTILDFAYAAGRFGIFDATQIQACSGPWTSDCL